MSQQKTVERRIRQQKKRLRRRLLGLALLFGLGLGGGYLFWRGWEGSHRVPLLSASAASPAPSFSMEDGSGKKVALAGYIGQKPVVLLFYMSYG